MTVFNKQIICWILSALFILVCEGRSELINTQSAAHELCGIKVSRVEKGKAPEDELSMMVTYDREKVGSTLVVVVRNESFKEIGKFEYVSQSAESMTGTGQALFTLNREYLFRSFLKTKSHIIPLRLYIDEQGKSIEGSKDADIKSTSSYATEVWPISLSFYKAQFGPASNNGTDEKPVFKQGKTQEELFRSWGLMPPEGTVFFSGLGKAAVVVRSTKAFLDELESELKKRKFLVEKNN